MNREQWLESRKEGLGASEAAIVLGISPYKSAYELWAEKRGLLERSEVADSEAAEWGIRLEPIIIQAFAERTGRQAECYPPHALHRHVALPWMLATPDARQLTGRGPGTVQIKTASQYKMGEWKDGPPLHYAVQIQHEMAVVGVEWCSIVVLIGGQRLRFFDVERNDRFLDAMIPQLADFWERVESGAPPEIDGSVRAAKALARLHPDDNGETIILPGEAATWFEEWQDAKDKISTLEKQEQLAKNRLVEAIGPNTIGVIAGYGSLSLKTQSRKETISAASKYRVLRKITKGKE